MLRTPPDILITTPESLYLMLTSQARRLFTGTQWVIVDEIHAVAQTKRGSHLAVTLERLAEQAGRDVQRIGLSATQRPLEEVARYLVGPSRECTVVDAGVRKPLDLRIHVPVESMVEPDVTLELEPLPGGSEATRRSIWPAIYPELLSLVREHDSTLVFVNNRRAAERIALRLNDLAAQQTEAQGVTGESPREIARAHHGSLAREERVVIEDQLKSGQLPCLVATSSLELGIDMGAVDLVIQVESPKSVTRGLQRIGRAGHGVGEVSRGRIFPKFRADLLECAVVARRMREGLIESTVVPRNPLDVLAQQVVAIAASAGEEGVAVDELHALFKRTWTYAELERRQLDNVLDMLDGRYPSAEFAELRSRIVWDRVAGTVRARAGARALAVVNAGTIPDRGLFSVNLPDGRRVGELDEEMVYEARAGQTFLLGATTWRIEQITRDRVVVTPAPGMPGAVPFWHGDSVGRPRELGEAIGAFAREAVRSDEARPAGGLRPGRAGRLQPARVPARAGGGHRGRAVRQDARRRALPRRDRRLAPVCALALRRPRARGVGAGALGAHPRRVRPRVGRDLVGRRHHHPPAGRGRAARGGARPRRPRGGRGPRGGRARRQCPVRRAVPRERRALAAHPARVPRPPHAAVAAAPQGAVAAGGRAAVPAVPGHPRDVSRVPARRPRRARPAGPAAQAEHAGDLPDRGRDPDRVAVRLVAALRLRRRLHVRGRHAGGRAARRGALAGPRAAARAPRPGGAARPHRPRGAGAGRGRPAAPLGAPAGARRRRAARRAAARRRPDRGGGGGARGAAGGRGRVAGAARGRAPRRARPRRRRGALVRRRGRRAVPRRPRRRPARRPARRLPRGRAGPAAHAAAPLRALARPVRDRRGARPLRRRPRPGARRARAGRGPRARRAAARWAPSASGATRTCCAACAGPRSPCCARRSSPSARRPWRGSLRPGRASTGSPPPAPASTGCATCWRRSRDSPWRRSSGRRTCCRAVSARTRRTGWTSCARAGRSCGWAGGRWARRTGRVALYFRDDAPLLGPPPVQGEAPGGELHEPAARAARPGRLLLLRPARRVRATRAPRSCARRSGTSPGPERSRTTPSRRCARGARRRRPAPRQERRAGSGRFRRRARGAPPLQGRWSLAAARLRRRGRTTWRRAVAPGPSCCSSGTAC